MLCVLGVLGAEQGQGGLRRNAMWWRSEMLKSSWPGLHCGLLAQAHGVDQPALAVVPATKTPSHAATGPPFDTTFEKANQLWSISSGVTPIPPWGAGTSGQAAQPCMGLGDNLDSVSGSWEENTTCSSDRSPNGST